MNQNENEQDPMTPSEEALFAESGLPGEWMDWVRAGYRISDSYPMRVTAHCRRLIQRPYETDPIARQFVPRGDEDRGPGNEDPLEEATAHNVPGLVHQYTNRVLLMPTGNCAVNCRYCNRRWSRSQLPLFTDQVLAAWIDYLNRTPDVTDVLITGGDPLTLADETLESILQGGGGNEGNLPRLPGAKKPKKFRRF